MEVENEGGKGLKKKNKCKGDVNFGGADEILDVGGLS